MSAESTNPTLVLIVEDSLVQAEMLRRDLERAGYAVAHAADGVTGLEAARARHPALIVTDINMPRMDGFQLCASLRAAPELATVPVIVLTTLADADDVLRGLEAGADAYLTKPYHLPSLLDWVARLAADPPGGGDANVRVQAGPDGRRVAVHPQRMLNLLLSTYEHAVRQNRDLVAAQTALEELNDTLEQRVFEQTAALRENERRLRESARQLERAMFGTLGTVSRMMTVRDPYTAGHEKRVGAIAAAIAEEMGCDARVQFGLRVASGVHDVGKFAIPAEILSKPGRLSPVEIALVRTHAEQGYEILKDIDFPWPVAEVAHQHHERLDGSGYPQGLKGTEILLEARITAVADVVEAMGSHRPYRPTRGIDSALEELEKGRGTIYDPDAVDACLRLFRVRGYRMPE